MANTITPEFIFGTEIQILALTNDSEFWFELGFYYPSDKDYFYQIIGGVMTKKCDSNSTAVGIKLNGSVIGGVKTIIEETDVLDIPLNYDYNTFSLQVDGQINNNGQINLM